MHIFPINGDKENAVISRLFSMFSIHNHIIWSSVSLEYDRKFRNFWGSTKAVRQLSDTICVENGLSIVENPKPHGKSYNKWLGDQAKPSHRELLRVAIDNALSQSPANFEELLKLLQESGCEVSKRGKSYRLKLPGWEKAARMDSLGEGYGLDDLQAVLSGKKTHTPRKKIVTQAETQKVNLLVDIQAKLQAGKGAGYARWAKVFNLKQMAQTMNYLSENNLLEYAVLEEKAAAATAHHNELSAQIKAAEKRILLYSGWRISEFLNLKPEDIDLKEGTMKGGTKTKAGKNRIVPIHPKIRPLIERRLAEGGPRLISYNGKVCNQTQYRIFWADIMKALKLNHTPHECRHTFETKLDSAGANRKCIDLLMGHVSKDTGNRVYNHKTLDELKATVELIP